MTRARAATSSSPFPPTRSTASSTCIVADDDINATAADDVKKKRTKSSAVKEETSSSSSLYRCPSCLEALRFEPQQVETSATEEPRNPCPVFHPTTKEDNNGDEGNGTTYYYALLPATEDLDPFEVQDIVNRAYAVELTEEGGGFKREVRFCKYLDEYFLERLKSMWLLVSLSSSSSSASSSYCTSPAFLGDFFSASFGPYHRDGNPKEEKTQQKVQYTYSPPPSPPTHVDEDKYSINNIEVVTVYLIKQIQRYNEPPNSSKPPGAPQGSSRRYSPPRPSPPKLELRKVRIPRRTLENELLVHLPKQNILKQSNLLEPYQTLNIGSNITDFYIPSQHHFHQGNLETDKSLPCPRRVGVVALEIQDEAIAGGGEEEREQSYVHFGPLAVHPAVQGLGLGLLFMFFAEEYAREHVSPLASEEENGNGGLPPAVTRAPASFLELQVVCNRTSLVKFYQKRGFRVCRNKIVDAAAIIPPSHLTRTEHLHMLTMRKPIVKSNNLK